MSGQTTEIMVASSAVLGILGGILRYVVRLAVTVDRAASTSQDTVTALREHATESAHMHEMHTQQLGEHAIRLAVVESKLP